MASTPPRSARLHRPSPDPTIARNLASTRFVPGERHAGPANSLSQPRLQTQAIALDHGFSSASPPLAGGAVRPPRSSPMLMQHPPRTSSIDWTSENLTPLRAPGSPIRTPVERPLSPTTPTKNYYSSPQLPIMTPPNTADRDNAKRRSWFGRSPQRATQEERGPTAWIAGHSGKIPYMTFGLASGQPVRFAKDGHEFLVANTYLGTRHLGPNWRLSSIPLPTILQQRSIVQDRVFHLSVIECVDTQSLWRCVQRDVCL